MIQPCRCDKCRTKFSVRYAKHAGMWEVYQRLAARHRRLKPKCAERWGVAFVRLHSPTPASQADG